MNIKSISLFPFKSSSGISDDKWIYKNPKINLGTPERLDKDNKYTRSATERSIILARMEILEKRIAAIKKATEAQIQKIRDYQLEVRMNADREIASKESEISDLRMESGRQISDLEIKLMHLEEQL